MPRNGSGVYSQPANTRAVSGATIESDKYNALVDDIVADLNAPRPITVGGTGANTAAAARAALGPWGDASFTPTGRSVATTLAAQANLLKWHVVTEPQYGAVPGGVVDCTAAIQAAVDAAEVAGGVVYFPAGTYLIAGTVTIDSSAVHIFGAGPQATILTKNAATGVMFDFNGGSGNIGNVSLSGVSLLSTVTRTADAAVRFRNCERFALRDFFISTHIIGVELEGSATGWIGEGEIKAVTATTGVGVRIVSGNDYYLNDMLIVGTINAQCKAGVEVVGTFGLWLDTVGCLQTGDGLLLATAANGTIENIFADSGCAWDTLTGHGLRINAATGSKIQRVQINGCWTATCQEHGVFITRAGTGVVQDVELVSHRSYNNQKCGIRVEYCDDLYITGGSIAGNSGAASATHSGVYLSGVTGLIMDGVRIGDQGDFGPSHKHNIEIASGCDKYMVVNCDVRGSINAGIADANTVNVERVIRNNIGHITERQFQASGTTDSNGDLVVSHGLSVTPGHYLATGLSTANIFATAVSASPTTATFRVWNGATGTALASTAVVLAVSVSR